MSEIINPKPPTERDLRILAFLNEGNVIDSASALGLFKTTGLRDCIYRLRKAGNIILYKDISYQTKEGENKYYRQWFTKENSILKAGARTQKEYKKKEKTAAEYAGEIITKSKKPKLSEIYNGNTLFNQQTIQQ